MAGRLEKLCFPDDTPRKSTLVKTTGREPWEDRRVDHAPFSRWHTQTLSATLKYDRQSSFTSKRLASQQRRHGPPASSRCSAKRRPREGNCLKKTLDAKAID